MVSDKRIEHLEKEVSELKDALTSVKKEIAQLSESAQFNINELRARLDAMSSSSS